MIQVSFCIEFKSYAELKQISLNIFPIKIHYLMFLTVGQKMLI